MGFPNAEAIFSGLVKGGLTPIAAIGVLGNIQNESTGALNSVGSGGCGLIGYTPCSSAPPGGAVTVNGPNPSVATQAAAVVTYIQNSYPGGITALNKITDPVLAGQSFAQLGERCAQCGPGGAQTIARGQNAANLFNDYKAGTLGSPTQGTAAAASGSGCVHVKGTCNPCDGINIDFLSSIPIVGGAAPKTNLFNGCQVKALTAGLLIGGGGFIMLAGVVLVAAYGLGHTGAGRVITSAAAPIPGVGRATGTAARVSRGQAPARSTRRSQARPQPAKRPPVRVPASQRAAAAGAKAGGQGAKQGIDTYDKGYADGVNAASGIDQSKRVRASDITSEGGNRTATGSTRVGTKRREPEGGMTTYPAGSGLVQGRTDQGVDFSGAGPLYAVGSGTILSTSNAGWPGGAFVALKLDNPPDAAHSVVYYAEGLAASVGVGQHVNDGQLIGNATGSSNGVELGWANPSALGQALAGAEGQFTGSNATGEGSSFLSFIKGGQPGTSTSDIGNTSSAQGVLGIGTHSQLKSIVGGLLTGAGGFILVVGVALVATHALGKTGAGKAALGVTSAIPGVGGVVGKITAAVR